MPRYLVISACHEVNDSTRIVCTCSSLLFSQNCSGFRHRVRQVLRRPNSQTFQLADGDCAMTSQIQSCSDVVESGCAMHRAEWSDWSKCQLRQVFFVN